MQRILLTTLSILFSYYSFAQRPVGNFVPKYISANEGGNTRDYIDTVKATSFIPQNEGGLGCFAGIYPAPDSGYVTGNNKYGDLQKAQFFSLHQMSRTAPGILQGVQVQVGLKSAVAGSQVFVYVYDVDTGWFQPGNLLAISNPVGIADIDITGQGNTFTFPLPVTVGDSFFVSVLLPAISGDTIAILSTVNDCRSYSGWSWEQWSNSTWHTLANSWILDVDLAIFPIIDLPFNVGIPNISSAAINGKLFPNPTSLETNLIYQVSYAGTIEITILNEIGKIVQQSSNVALKSGTHIETIDLQMLPAGLYFVLISNGYMQQVLSLMVEK
ncbi:MAG: T9SS type A sorting domain-containing protein [Chitinophagales bacterium]